MQLKILGNDNRVHRPSVTLQPACNRILFNKMAWLLLVEKSGSGLEFMQIFFNELGDEKVFWVALCESSAPGSRKLDSPSALTRTCNISNLLQALRLEEQKKAKFAIEWDDEAGAFKVDLNHPISIC